jgi:hypothetical protein
LNIHTDRQTDRHTFVLIYKIRQISFHKQRIDRNVTHSFEAMSLLVVNANFHGQVKRQNNASVFVLTFAFFRFGCVTQRVMTMRSHTLVVFH